MKLSPPADSDLEMPGPARWMAEEIVKKALDNGTLTEEMLNDKVRRLLGVIEKAGLFENPDLQPERGEDKPQHRKIIRQAAQEAIVLLKNDGTLPLKKVKSIAVIGPYANAAKILGGGSSSVTPHYVVTPFEGIKIARATKSKWITHPDVLSTRICLLLPLKHYPPPTGASDLAPNLFNGTKFSGDPVYSEITTRVQHGWFDRSVPNANQEYFSMRMEGFFTPKESGIHTLALNGVGWSKLYLDDKLIIDHSS